MQKNIDKNDCVGSICVVCNDQLHCAPMFWFSQLSC